MDFSNFANKYLALTFLLCLSVTNKTLTMEFSAACNSQINGFENLHTIDLKKQVLRAISPCGNYVASGSNLNESGSLDKQVILYNIKTKQKAFSYYHNSFIKSLAFSQCGNYVASGSHDGQVIVYNLKTKLFVLSYNHKGWIASLTFSKLGNYIASSSQGGHAIVYNLQTKKESFNHRYNSFFIYFAFSKCENYISFGLQDGRVIIYNLKTQKEAFNYKHNNTVNCLAFSNPSLRKTQDKLFPGKHYIASGSYKEIIVYNLNNQKEAFRYYNDSVGQLYGNYIKIDFEPFANFESRKEKVILYDLTKQKTFSHKYKDELKFLTFSKCSNYIASGYYWNGQVIIYDIKNQKEAFSYNHNDQLKCLAFSNPSSNLICNYIASGSDEGLVLVYDLKTKKEAFSYKHKDSVDCLYFNNKNLISVDKFNEIKAHKLPIMIFDQIKKTTIKLRNKKLYVPKSCNLKYEICTKTKSDQNNYAERVKDFASNKMPILNYLPECSVQ